MYFFFTALTFFRSSCTFQYNINMSVVSECKIQLLNATQTDLALCEKSICLLNRLLNNLGNNDRLLLLKNSATLELADFSYSAKLPVMFIVRTPPQTQI